MHDVLKLKRRHDLIIDAISFPYYNALETFDPNPSSKHIKFIDTNSLIKMQFDEHIKKFKKNDYSTPLSNDDY